MANFTLTLDDQMAGLSIGQPVTLDAAGEQIVTGNADLSLNGGISATAGTLSSTGGILSLPGGATLASGTLFSTSNTTINIGGILEVADTWTSTSTSILLTDNASLSSTAPLSLATLDTNGYGLMLESATSDLTITEGVTIRYPAGGGPTINSGEADLTLNGSVNVPDGGIRSSGGTVTFGAGSSGASFTDNSGMMLEDTTLVLQTALDLPYLHFTGTSSFQTNGNTLNLKYLEIGVQNELDLTNVVTNNESELFLLGNSAITKTGDLVFKQIVNRGYTLTLNAAITSLTAKHIHIPNLHDSNEPNYLASTGKLLAQGVDVTLRKQIYLKKGTIEMGGGTLTLEQDGYLQEDGVLDLSNSVLEISGQFKNDGGTLTTSGSTLRLKGNTYLGNGGPVTFATFEPNGWGLKLTDNTTHLTLAGDVLLQPNDESWNNMTDSSSLDFDGTNDYVNVASNSSLDFTGSFTAEAWFYKRSGAFGGLASQWTSAGGRRWEFDVTGAGQLIAIISDNGNNKFQLTTVETISLNKWHHAVLVFDAGGSCIIYLDGEIKSVTQDGTLPTSVNNSSKDLTIGKSLWGGNKFKGAIDEVRIWNVARTQAEIQANMNKELSGSESGLVAYYKMNDGSGTSLIDSSSNSNTGTLTNMTDEGWVAGNPSVTGSNSASPFAVIGIESNEASLTISGAVTLRDNASIQSSGGAINLNGSLAIEDGTADVSGGTLSLAGGSVGANGLIEVGEQGNLSLGGNLAVAGTLDLNDGATINLANNATANLSGGQLELAGSHVLDGITTNASTTLQINSSGSISRTGSGTNTVGDLLLVPAEGS
ncbi:MAG: LamG domain-containing protein, partial [Gammaproteobacteria bacterium]|nr:LamG domain-containing protein [Gammaproteobacteria bacterium]